jgi:hypothetical protein
LAQGVAASYIALVELRYIQNNEVRHVALFALLVRGSSYGHKRLQPPCHNH